MRTNKKIPIYGLILIGLKDLTLAVLLGTVLFLPFYFLNEISTTARIEFNFSQLPENDLELENWYKNAGIKELKIDRRENTVVVNYKKRFPEILNTEWVFPEPAKLEEMGYKGEAGRKLSNEFTPSFNILVYITPVLLCSQIGFLLIGLWRIRRLRMKPMEHSYSVRKISTLWKISLGVIAGFILVISGFLYDFICQNLFGFQSDTAGFWNQTKSFSFEAKSLIVFLGIIIAPICEEIFFRGAVLRNFARNGFAVFGIFFSSLMFATVHFDFLSFPAYFVLGIILALTYLKTNSLVPAIIAHSINNAVAFYLIYA